MAVNTTGQALPLGWGTTVGTSSVQVLPVNPSRLALVFINSSPSVAVGICPSVVNAGVNGVYTGAAASVAAINGAGSITMNPGDKFIIDSMNVTTAWNGIAAGAGGQLTILES